ncbi:MULTISPECIES: DUF6785 family protein [Desulfococcus]|jgi:hypothetical protein|uniref:Uncharacterized protein n=1 Tax=Desulfococcus multivorans DSM 2059 TaxID=1121405 RepID=S7TVM0_DESML|nr:DUF6785 family protein [Desulfococcus multivorans]AOY60326.1 conserved uncharacterized protein [Desulfococcus multivorans]AQV02431.1 hypothetical protein B2D07_17775 [Desulfococcus multivorans]EPR41112.1 hypothetical protein dsmv_2227 [Desulfococcus multivorans DSM 2059]MDX9818053.1 hypothetical protein [Desulfococcus multivorans]SJZ58927.1 hypothetical protein SAMN02745446_01025 [Desulfococcus multivorans DSM 2059]
MSAHQHDHETIRLRALILGIVLATAMCALTPYNNAYKQATPLGGGHFPLAPFFILVWLTVLTALAGRVFKRALFTGKELVIVWMLMFLVSGIAYTGLVRTFFINLTAPYHFATVGNAWKEVLHPILPRAWYPNDAEAVERLYNGLPDGRRMGWWTLVTHIPWRAWIGPLMVWGGFILLCYGVMICLVNLFSRQWIYNERMNFPLLRVPQLLADALDQGRTGAFFGNRFLAAGLFVPIFLHTVNGLNFYFPEVPQIPTLILAGPYFPQYGLFSGFHKLKIYIYPAFIGFAFLTTRQISFSFWFFFIAGGLIMGLLAVLGYNIPDAALGVTFGPTLTRPEETQMIGAYGVFFLFILWLSRYHLREIFQTAVGRRPAPTPVTEWFSIRTAFWGSVAGISGIILWCWIFRMPFMVSVLVVGAFFMVMLVASRVICQGGIAYFTLTVAPIDGLLALFGPKFFTQVGLLGSAVMQKVLFVDLRESLMPSLVHSSSLTQRTTNRRTIFLAMLITLLLAVTVSFVAMLALCYKFGARELQMDWTVQTTTTVYANVQRLIEAPPQNTDWVRLFAAAGAVVMLVLVLCYHRFPWWPIHPIGYLTTYSSAMRILWVSFFIGWLANSLCMRYGGVALFKQLRYFFIGLIIGDFLMGGTWAVIGLFGDASYQVLPD